MLPTLGQLQPILATKFRRKGDGMLIMAQLYPPRQTATGGVEEPFRIVRTGPKSILKPGDVLVGGTGKKYLMIRSGIEEEGIKGASVFKCVEMDRTGILYRTIDTLNETTKRTEKVLTRIGEFDYDQTPMRQAEDSSRIQYDRYEILTDYPLQKGDNINKNMVVEQAEIRLGVTWARVRDA